MGIWQPVTSGVTGTARAGGMRKRLTHGEKSPEEAAADQARMDEMCAERRPAHGRPQWRPESTLSALGRPVDSREEYNKILKSRGLLEVSKSQHDAGITKPKVDIEAIQRDAFEKAREQVAREIAQGVPAPRRDGPPMTPLILPGGAGGFGNMASLLEDAKRRHANGALVGGDTGEPETFSFTEPKATNDLRIPRGEVPYSAMEAQVEGQSRMMDRLVARGAPGV